MSRQRGIALPLILWTLVLLSLIAASLNGDAREAMRSARNAAASARAEAMADGGVYRAAHALLAPPSEQGWRTDGRPYRIQVAGGQLEIGIQDAAGLVDLNTGAEELLAGLLAQAGLAPNAAHEVTDAIVQRRAEMGPFNDAAEIRQIAGIPAAIARRLEPLLTVHTGQRGVDPMTAPPAVLLAMPGVTAAEVEEMLSARASGEAANLGGGFTAESPRRVFVIHSEASMDGATFRRLAVLRMVRQVGRPFIIHAWRTQYDDQE